MKEPKKRGRPAKGAIEAPEDGETRKIVAYATTRFVSPENHRAEQDEVADDIPEVIIYAKSLNTETRTTKGRETLDVSVVYRVEAEIGRTANAWGMIDPLELIRAVDRVLRGGER